jgi:hypothetical protein
MLFAPPTPPWKAGPRKSYRLRFMTGLAIGGLSGFRFRTTARHRARLPRRAIRDPTRLLRNRGVLSQLHVSLCQHDFVLKGSSAGQTRFPKVNHRAAWSPNLQWNRRSSFHQRSRWGRRTEPSGKEYRNRCAGGAT